jgi:hypothetical protein
MNMTDEEIMSLYHERRGAQGLVINRMRELQTAVNGDVVTVIRDLDRAEKPKVANLVKQSLDEIAMRIAENPAMIDCPPLKPHIDKSVRLAEQREAVLYGWWDWNQIPKKTFRVARHLQGYGMTVSAVHPDMTRGIPKIELRNPLTTFPAPSSDPDDMLPHDVIFVYQHTMGWLKRVYPKAYDKVASPRSKPSDTVDVLEYDDADETVLIAMSKPDYSNIYNSPSTNSAVKTVRIDQYVNLAKRPRVVVAGRVTLDRLMGQFDGVLPLYQARAHMFALEMIAAEKGIFPDMVIEGFPNSNAQPTLVSGDWQDGRTGNINMLQNGSVKTLPMNPGVFGMQAIDRLQQSEMQESRTPAEFGGLSPTNVRTNARGAGVMASTIDSTIGEAQVIIASALQEQNKVCIAVAKGWFGNTPKSIYVSWKGAKGQVEYTPNVTFETDNNVVSYAMAGTDKQNLIIAIESSVGAGIMSTDRGMELHPMVDDKEKETRQIALESLRKTGLTLLEQQAAQGQMQMTDYVAVILAFKKDGMNVEDAMLAAHAQAQKAQAAQVAAPPPVGAPEGQPGINGAAGQPPVGPPSPGTMDVAQLLGALHGQQPK